MKAIRWFLLLLVQGSFLSAESWQEHRQFFQENGYLWIKDFFSAEQVLSLRNWADEMNRSAQGQLLLKPIDRLALIVVPERSNPNQVCRVEDMLTCYPEFHAFIEASVTSFLEQLLESPYVLFKDKLNFKWPGGGAFLPHQDFPAYEAFAPRTHVTAMVCIDAATLQNGCLQVAQNWKELAPSSDTPVLPYIEGGGAHGSIRPDYVAKLSWLPLKTSPRDLVLISSFVPHYSEPNHSDQSRRAMFFTYNKLEEGEFRTAYYHTKRNDPENPAFHFGTPTNARGK